MKICIVEVQKQYFLSQVQRALRLPPLITKRNTRFNLCAKFLWDSEAGLSSDAEVKGSIRQMMLVGAA